jgi:hypothetical protein
MHACKSETPVTAKGAAGSADTEALGYSPCLLGSLIHRYSNSFIYLRNGVKSNAYNVVPKIIRLILRKPG